jgi:predicted DNA-binding protein (MmcQ/YjbR family)
MATRLEARIRKLCLALPEAHEKEAWGTPTFRVKDKMFAMWTDADSHNGKGNEAIWIKSDADNQQLMISLEPKRYFSPPYMGPSGWVGVYVNAKTDWKQVEALLRDAWESIAPKKLLKQRDEKTVKKTATTLKRRSAPARGKKA